MQIYLVGGAVRDELLGRPVGERDWVVVGATPEEMQRRGYRAVGREFPVYLHPETHEEYALARRERKVGPGYRGFTTQFSPEVSLEEDLQRRDLTINAIARAPDGQLIDPFGGQRDLERRLLRHVSAAFVEDPVRILRVARFAARFAELGFTVVPETRQLMRQIVDAGEVRAVVPERLWRELERALQEPHPEAAFDTLQECGALPVLLPELAWGEHQRCVLQAAVSVSLDAAVRFAALLAAGTPIAAIESLADRLRIPNHHRDLAVLAARWSGEIGKAQHLDAHGLLQLLEGADAFRRGERFQALLAAAQAVQIGQRGAAAGTTTHARATASSQLLAAALAAATAVSLPAEQLAALKGTAIAVALHAAREQRIGTLLCERPG